MLHQLKWTILPVMLLALVSCANAPTTPAPPTAPPISLITPGPQLTQSVVPATLTGLAFNPTDESLLKVDAGGLFRFTFAKGAWEVISVPADLGLTGLALNPDDPTQLYVSGLSVGVLKSTDGGQNWTAVNNGLPTTKVSALAMHSFRRETLYVWLWSDGIYRTEDGGLSWRRMPDEGPPDKDVQGLVHSTLPGSMNTGWLYASTPSGAYMSMDCF